MRYFDVFNGDADGICALQQLRLAEPREATLITGAKRDIALVARAAAQAQAGDDVTVLDISLDTNRTALAELLACGAHVTYFDHHFAGEVPDAPNLAAHIDTASDVCTSVLVDRHLGGRFRLWAITAAWGDNLGKTAAQLARDCGLDDAASAQLRELGESINYNAYGDSVDDLLITPIALYEALRPYANPFDFIAAEPLMARLSACRHEDMALARERAPLASVACGSVHVLPDTPWARRVRGVYANELANAAPACAHAVLTELTGGGYAVSVRAPLASPRGADQLCRAFPGGNGRVGAAGIECLASDRLDAFIEAFTQTFGTH